MEPSSALLKLHEAARERGENPLEVTPVTVVGPTGPPPREFIIEKPDWDQVRREEQAAEREARIAEAAALLETVEAPAQPTPPAARRSRWRG
jgi:hypothetical protein